MRDFDYFTKLEFNIHGLEEIEISPKASRLRPTTDDNIKTAILPSGQQQSETSFDNTSSESTDGKYDADESNSLSLMKENLGERGESILLKDLKALKEEAWAKKKARKLRKLKRVQFQEKHQKSLPFHRTCCHNKNKGNLHLLVKEEGESTKIQNFGSSNKMTMTMKTPQGGNSRPTVELHSIDMFKSIIPINSFTKTSIK